MKKDIHPKFYTDCKVTCACGNSFITGSTMKEIRVELCNKCHPFYTGKQKFVDSARRVEKFKEKIDKKAAMAEAAKNKKAAKQSKTEKPTKTKKSAVEKTPKNKATKKA